jgi:hypothetical protein
MSLKDAFNSLLAVHARTVTITRRLNPGPNLTGTVKITPANYFRKLAGPDQVIMEGREFVITKDALTEAGFTNLRRGDIFNDPEMGNLMADSIREMYDLGGAIIGYRFTTS